MYHGFNQLEKVFRCFTTSNGFTLSLGMSTHNIHTRTSSLMVVNSFIWMNISNIILNRFKIIFNYLYMYFRLCWSSLLHRLQSCRERSVETTLQLQSRGFSLRWFLLLWSSGSRACGLNSCGSQTQLLCGMWDLPRPGIKPLSPALAGRLFTTELPRKLAIFFKSLDKLCA